MNVTLESLPDTLHAQFLSQIAAPNSHMVNLGNEIAAYEFRQTALMGIMESLATTNFPMLSEYEWVHILNALNFNEIDSLLFNLDQVARNARVNVIASFVDDDAGDVTSRIEQLTQMETFSCCIVAQRFWGQVYAGRENSIAKILAEISGLQECDVFISEH